MSTEPVGPRKVDAAFRAAMRRFASPVTDIAVRPDPTRRCGACGAKTGRAE